MKVLVYTNILTPYRKYFYDLLYKKCLDNNDEFKVFVMAESEPNRNWKYSDFQAEYTKLLYCRTKIRGETYIHFNKGLKAELKSYKPDVVICAGSYICPGVWTVCNNKKKLNYKVLFWSESHLNESRDYGFLKLRIREFLRKKIYKKFDGFLCAGKLSEQFVLKYNNKASRFFLPNLIDERKYAATRSYSAEQKQNIAEKYGVNTDKFIFFCPARLSVAKGIIEFLTLFSKTANKDKAALLIAGNGELENAIRDYSRENGLDVRLLGYKTQQETIELYSIANAFLMPSKSDPNPLTCVEALFCGLPLLVSNHVGNYPEVVKEDENGYVFDYGNEKESIEKIDKIISADGKWLAHAEKTSLEIARENYVSEEQVARLAVFLKSNAIIVK